MHHRVIFIHCLYSATFNTVLRIGRVARLVEPWTDDLDIVGSSPLSVTIIYCNNVMIFMASPL